MEDRIRERRIEHIRLCKMGPPKTLGFAPLPPPTPGATVDGTRLSGQCASPGRYEGIARVILDPSTDARLEPGEVLVAPYTDPAWTPLFARAAAVVTDIGRPLRHSSLLAREYGIPAGKAPPPATRALPSGPIVTGGGHKGNVTLEPPYGGVP